MRHVLTAILLAALASRAVEAAVPSACAPITDLDALLEPGTRLFVGELHGTREHPAAVADIVCRAVELGRSVVVGLELDARWDAAFDRFLATPKVEPALAALRAETGWERFPEGYPPDGRTSEAMLGLLRDLHALRVKGGRIGIRAFDGWIALPEAERKAARDLLLAKTLIRSLEASPSDLAVVLTGNLHNRKKADTVPFLAEPMAYLVAKVRPEWKLVSLLGTYSAGEAWFCQPDRRCGPTRQASRTPLGPRRVVLDAAVDTPFGKAADLGYDGTIYVGAITASPPVSPAPP